MEWFTGSERESLILLSWAFKHPYLYFGIRVATNPNLFIVIILAALKIMLTRRNRYEKGYNRTR
jgi:hypothetical protein